MNVPVRVRHVGRLLVVMKRRWAAASVVGDFYNRTAVTGFSPVKGPAADERCFLFQNPGKDPRILFIRGEKRRSQAPGRSSTYYMTETLQAGYRLLASKFIAGETPTL
jgi:hypothetical protein